MPLPARARVCVIGAGISGLVAAKVLREDGFDVVVFEKEASLGGVWAASRTYPGLHANNPRDTYAFSDHPYPATADDFPSAPQVRAYLESYADRFGLRPNLRLATEVVQVARSAPDGDRFRVMVRGVGEPGRSTTEEVDFVVVCNGVFSQPQVPDIDGMAEFSGRALHSSQATDPALVEGRRVLVVGAGKSSIDCAAWAARTSRACTLLFRQPYWMVPRYLFGVISLQYLLFTRLTELFLRYHRPSRFEALLHDRAAPLARGWWRGVSALLQRTLRMPREMTPQAPLPLHLENIAVVSDFYDLVRAGRGQARAGTIARFTGGDAVQLDSGEVLAADVVIFATGWRQQVAFLADELRRQVERAGAFHLYRFVLPPDVPQLGFIGYNSSTACQLTSEIAAHWLAQVFRGELALPTRAEMHAEIARVHRWAAQAMPARGSGYFIGPYLIHHLDELLRDMRLPTRRSSNFLSEHLLPMLPARYRSVGDERRRARGEAATIPCAPLYVSGVHWLAAVALLTLAWALW